MNTRFRINIFIVLMLALVFINHQWDERSSHQVRSLANVQNEANDFKVMLEDQRTFDLRKPTDVLALAKHFNELNELLKRKARPEGDGKNQTRFPEYFFKDSGVSDKKLTAAFKYIIETCAVLEKQFSEKEAREVQELTRALELNTVNPLQDSYNFRILMKLVFKSIFVHPFLKGKDPATVDPEKSFLWEEPGEISKKDLKYGFNRTQLPISLNEVCDYDEPKTGYGTQPGYTMKCGGKKIKIKFKEIHSEAFTTRVMWALGYHVEPVDFAPAMHVRYDRKLLKEFNDRKNLNIKIKLFGIHVFSRPFVKYLNPIQYIDHLILKDGSIVAHDDIREFLFKPDAQYLRAEEYDESFNAENEAKVVEIVHLPAQIQQSRDEVVKVGPWSFNELEHPSRLEMRALLMVASWLNWYDVRFDNNRVILEPDASGKIKMNLYLSDLGSTLGEINVIEKAGLSKSERPDLFGDRFTRVDHKGKFQMRKRFGTLNDVESFNDATPQDVQWMAEKMLQLTPQQIHDALVWSGFNNDDVKTYETNLLKRLEYMKADLGM